VNLADLRRDYARAALDESAADADPLRLFARWLEEARRAELLEPNAMTLATATKDGVPSARVVLLKGADERGFTFFTDRRSRKGQELGRNAAGAIVFWWGELERQVRVEGPVVPIADADSDAYYASRPEGSRVSAWASHQSAPVPGGRAALERQWAEASARYAGAAIPRPPYWGGYRLEPVMYEFWQGRPNRLHDRIRYLRGAGGAWAIDRLSP
jgi:pyridoxamine 5'-phosphate oxidase